MQSDSAFSFAQFCDSVFRTIAANGSDRLVVDLRFNNGGDNSLDDEFIQRLVRAPTINRAGHIYIIVGRKTFSAAVNLAAELERHTPAILVGEPTAAPANHYGETHRLTLPHSGLTVLYSTLYWQSGDPRDTRSALEPSISAPLLFRDYKNGRDPALDAILAQPVPPHRDSVAGDAWLAARRALGILAGSSRAPEGWSLGARHRGCGVARVWARRS
jgi:C-terminal processing protease CtpA/Prc